VLKPGSDEYVLSNLGESPVSALQEQLPKGVNPVVVQEVLGEIYDLEELKKHRDIEWAGTKAISDTINRYLSEWERWREMSSRGAPRFPTMHAWDGKGRPHRGGIGSDSGEISTYIDSDGNRKKFALELVDVGVQEFVAPWTKEQEPIPDSLVEDWDKGRLECPVDGWTTSFKPESKQSYNLARARIAKHCRSSKDERVREFALKAFS
jgi:hypothetical protein